MGGREPAEAERARVAAALAALRRRVFLADQAFSWVFWVVVWVLLARAAQPIREATARWGTLVVALPLMAGLFAVYTVTASPLAYYRGYMLPKWFGLSRQSWWSWLADWAKTAGLGLGLALVVGETFYFLVGRWPGSWWWLFAAALAAGSLLMAYVAPRLLVPIFYRMEPLGDVELAERVRRLLDMAGTRVGQICTLDFSRRTAEANAAVIGLGPSRMIVLADTLVRNFTPAEAEAVVAHELGHHVHRDVWWGLAFQMGIVIVGLWTVGTFMDPALESWGLGGVGALDNLPGLVLAAQVYSLVTMPLANLLSRWREARADRYALRLCGDPHAFLCAMLRLEEENLLEHRPPRWAEVLLYSHPPMYRRIALANELTLPPGAREVASASG